MKKTITFSVIIYLCLAPNSVFAHGLFKGLGSFYNGLLHPVFVPEQIITIIALGLFLGQQAYQGHKLFFTFIFSLLLGLIFNGFNISIFSANTEKNLPIIISNALIIISLIASFIVILKTDIPQIIALSLLIAGGLFIGLDSSPPNALIIREQWLFLFGVGVAVYMLFLYPITFGEYFKKVFWKEMVVRILASWIAASSLMVWAISFRMLY